MYGGTPKFDGSSTYPSRITTFMGRNPCAGRDKRASTVDRIRGGNRLGLAAPSAHDDDQNDHEDREDQRHDDADNQASDILGRREWNSGQRETSEDHVAPHERDHKTERSPKRARNRFPDL